MRVAVVLNRDARGIREPEARGRISSEISANFRDCGATCEISECHSHELRETIERSLQVRPDAIVVGGGDGTVNAGAEACSRARIPLGVLPLGTRNHFSRDLKIPSDLRANIACICSSPPKQVDLGIVNGRPFVNNSSVGAYPRIIEERHELRSRFGFRKYVAGVIAAVRVFSRRPFLFLNLELDGKMIPYATPFVFVGNNRYEVSLFSVRFRDSITAGTLCVYTTRCNGLAGLTKLFGLALLGRLEQSRDFEVLTCSALRVHLRSGTIRVSLDGEVVKLATPLEYRSAPAAIEVFAPR